MNDRFLRKALAVNGVFSFATGSVMALVPEVVGDWIGFEHSLILRVVGAMLLAFAGLLFCLSFLSRRPQFLAMLASVADFAWVVGTVALAIVLPNVLSGAGWVIASGVAAVVMACGVAQAMGIARSYRHPDTSREGWQQLCLEFQVDIAPAALWEIVRELDAIHEYAPGLAGSSIEEGGATDRQVRECRDAKGNCWREDVLIDDARRRLEMTFLTDRQGFPFPFLRMEGGWSLESAASTTRLRIWWDVVPKRRWLSFVLMPMFSLLLAHRFRATIKNMRETALGVRTEAFAGRRNAVVVGVC